MVPVALSTSYGPLAKYIEMRREPKNNFEMSGLSRKFNVFSRTKVCEILTMLAHDK